MKSLLTSNYITLVFTWVMWSTTTSFNSKISYKLYIYITRGIFTVGSPLKVIFYKVTEKIEVFLSFNPKITWELEAAGAITSPWRDRLENPVI